MNITDRFMAKVSFDPETGCWLWTAYIMPSGYGQFWDGERVRLAHQWSYEYFVKPIPAGLEPDHTCRVRRCVCPDHLEPVTRKENLRRGDTRYGRADRSGLCLRGHPLSGANLYTNGDRRGCRKCRELLYRRWVMRNRNRRREIDRAFLERRRNDRQETKRR